MGSDFTASALQQRFVKKLSKMDPYEIAKAEFGKGSVSGESSRSAPSTPSKKRKAVDELSFVKKEEDD